MPSSKNCLPGLLLWPLPSFSSRSFCPAPCSASITEPLRRTCIHLRRFRRLSVCFCSLAHAKSPCEGEPHDLLQTHAKARSIMVQNPAMDQAFPSACGSPFAFVALAALNGERRRENRTHRHRVMIALGVSKSILAETSGLTGLNGSS